MLWGVVHAPHSHVAVIMKSNANYLFLLVANLFYAKPHCESQVAAIFILEARFCYFHLLCTYL